MTNVKFADTITRIYYGWSDVALMTYKVGKVNVAVYYSAANDGSELRPRRKPPYLIKITTLGRYPRLIKSERVSTLNDALRWLIEEFRQNYAEGPALSDEELEEEMLLAGMEI